MAASAHGHTRLLGAAFVTSSDDISDPRPRRRRNRRRPDAARADLFFWTARRPNGSGSSGDVESRRGARCSDETRSLRAEPDRDAAHRERALRGREPPLRRLDAAADRRHRPGAERRRAGRRRSSRISGGSGSSGTRGRFASRSAASDTARRRSSSARRGSTASRSSARTAPPPTSSPRVVDDVDFGITHVIRGNDHRPNEPIHRRLARGARDARRRSTSTTG